MPLIDEIHIICKIKYVKIISYMVLNHKIWQKEIVNLKRLVFN